VADSTKKATAQAASIFKEFVKDRTIQLDVDKQDTLDREGKEPPPRHPRGEAGINNENDVTSRRNLATSRNVL
jgi:hypothetical protein